MTVNNMINNGFYAKSETFGGNGRRTPRSTEIYTRVFSLDVLTGSGLSFTCDPQLAKQLLGYPECLNNE